MDPRQNTSVLRHAVAMVVALMVVGACSVQADDIAATSNDADQSGGHITALVSRLPASLLRGTSSDDPADYQIYVGDYVLATAAAELELPDRTSLEATEQWLTEVTRTQTNQPASFDTFVARFPAIVGVFSDGDAEAATELGFSLLAVDNFATFRGGQDLEFAVFGGALEVSDQLRSANPYLSVGQGADLQLDVPGRTPLRPVGHPLRVAADTNLVAVTNWTPAIESWLDRDPPSLLVDERFQTLATALDSVNVLSAAIYISETQPGRTDPRAISVPFVGLGFGAAMMQGQPAAVIVYAFATVQDAQRALPEIEDGWRNGQAVASGEPYADEFDSLTVEQAGRAIIVAGPVASDGSTLLGDLLYRFGEPILQFQPNLPQPERF